MTPKILTFDVPLPTAGKSREFCIQYENIFILQENDEVGTIHTFHDNKKVIGGIDKETQMRGNPSLIYDTSVSNTDTSADIVIDAPSFFLNDPAGVNYIHFFFCFFGKCYYYDQLIKNNIIKLYIPEKLISMPRASFIREWISLYYPHIKINILEMGKRYKFKNLIIPNAFYNFPQPYGYEMIYKMIKTVVDKIDIDESLYNKKAYISRQDTIKRGWYHNRVLQNELQLIKKLKNVGYDIIELMDYDMKDKIKLFKSYKTIIQQSSASVVSILFSNAHTTHCIIEHPKMNWWLTPKCREFSNLTKSTLITIEEFGELLPSEKQNDANNYPWQLIELDYLIENIETTIK